MLLSLVISSLAVAGGQDSVVDSNLKERHLKFAKKTNGETWKLLQKEILSKEEKDLILYTVYASAYHWSNAGTEIHMQRAEWIISRVYTKLNNPDLALVHAKKCLSLTNDENEGLKDFDYAYAYEAMARAYALANDFQNATKYYKKAIYASGRIGNNEDKKLFISDLKDGDWNGFSLEK